MSEHIQPCESIKQVFDPKLYGFFNQEYRDKIHSLVQGGATWRIETLPENPLSCSPTLQRQTEVVFSIGDCHFSFPMNQEPEDINIDDTLIFDLIDEFKDAFKVI